MTTHDNDKAHDAAEREAFGNWEHDAAVAWESEYSHRVEALCRSAFEAGVKFGRSALTASEAKVQLTDEQILAVLGKCAKREGGYTMIDFARALLASAPSSPAQEDVAGELLAALREVRHSLQFANDNPGGGISDTIWMMHRPETLFDFIDTTLERFAPPALSAQSVSAGGQNA